MTTTNPGNVISDLASLERYIQSLEGNRSSQQRETSGAPASSVSPAEASQRTANLTTIEQMRTQINTFINQRKNRFADAAPTYLKPAFFVDQYTPYLRLELIYYQREKPDDFNSQLIEKKIDILSDPINDINNHVRSFKYTIKNEGNEPNIDLNLIDINQEILDFMVLQYSSIERLSSMVAYIKVTYGWYDNKLNPPADFLDWSTIAFTNTVYAAISEIKVSYGSGGIPEATIRATVDTGFQGPLKHLNPYHVLGPMPAVTLCIKEFLEVIEDVMQYAKNKDEYTKLGACGFLVAFMKNKGAADPGIRRSVITEIIKYYALLYPSYYNPIVDKVNSIMSTYGDQSLDNNVNIFTIIKRNIRGVNLMPVLTNLIERENFDKNGGTEPQQQEQYHIYLRQRLQERPANAADRLEKRAWVKMFRMIGTIVQDNFIIHPYFVWRYAMNIFIDKVKINNSSDKEIKIFQFDGIDINPTKLFPNRFVASYSPSWAEVKWADTSFFPTAQSNKAYYKKADNYNVSPFRTWKDFLTGVSSDCKIKFELSAEAATLYGVQTRNETVRGTSLVPGEGQGAARTITYTPMKIETNFFMCDYKAAKLNLDIYERSLKARLAYLTNNTSVGGSEASRTLAKETINKALGYIQTRKNDVKISTEYYMFVLRDAMASDMIFNPEVVLNNVVQAYSYNINGLYDKDPNGYFNPGKPNCLHVNFPDVISFTPTLDYNALIRSLSVNAQISSEYEYLNEVINEDTQTRVESLLERARTTVNSAPTSGNNRALINTLKDLVDQIRRAGSTTDPSLNTIMASERVSLNTFDYSQNRIYGGQLDQALSRKRDIQEIRKKLLTVSLPFTATMDVIGDATYTLRDMGGKYIYLKFTNLDGTMSMFSGIYLIDNIVQEISTGQFKTSFKLTSARTANDPESLKQINAMVYNNDRQSMYPINTGLGDRLE